MTESNGIGGTTEWEDILVKKGIINPREYVKTQSDYQKEAQEKLEQYDPLENKNLKELEEMDDDFDEEFLNMYKQQRMEEMKEYNMKPRFGGIIEISKQDWVEQVNNAPEESIVVIHLYQSYIEICNLLNEQLAYMAQKYPTVKFIKIVSTRAIENFPDQRLPCLIVYQGGKPLHNLSQFDKLLKVKTFEFLEMMLGVLQIIDYKTTPENEFEMKELQKLTGGKIILQSKNKEEDDGISDDEDRDDREYISNNYKKQFIKY